MINHLDNNPHLSECACRNLRMTTRVITRFYDNALQSTGLKATQFSMLNDIASNEDGISIGDLSEHAHMDQTTTTRNIGILLKEKLVEVIMDDSDLRKKKITVSPIGKEKLAIAIPLWKEVQLRLQNTIGEEQYRMFLHVLVQLREME